MKRTWITVKRGILEPKHRFALGELIWLYIYILDLTNWEAGVIEEWLDRGAAEEMEMPLATLIDQRRKLEQKGYITCQRKQHGIRVIVHNWTNPREYTGKKYNEKSPSDTPSDTLVNTPINTLEIETPYHESVPSYNQKSKIKSQKEIDNHSFVGEFLRIADILGLSSNYQGEQLVKLKNKYGEARLLQYAEWCKSKEMLTMDEVMKAAAKALDNWKEKPMMPEKPKKKYTTLDGEVFYE